MADVFEIGKSYRPNDSGFDPVQILRRTAKCIVVKGGSGNTWRMIVRTDADGNEYVTDSAVPLRWREAMTYCANNPVKEL